MTSDAIIADRFETCEQAAYYPPAFPLKHAQKDMKLALLLADECGLGLPTSAAANEQVCPGSRARRNQASLSLIHRFPHLCSRLCPRSVLPRPRVHLLESEIASTV